MLSARRESLSIAVWTSASVSVRLGDRNVRRSDRLTLTVGNALALVAIELDALDTSVLGAAAADRRHERRRRQGVVDEHRDVARDRRVARQRLDAQIACAGPSAQPRRGRSRRRRPVPRQPAGAGDRRARAGRRVRPRVPSSRAPRGSTGATSHGSRHAAVESHVERRSASQTRSTTPLMSKKSTSRAPPAQCSPVAAPVHAHATARRSPRSARSARRSRTAGRRAARAAGCARRRRSGPAAATGAARRSSPTAGWRSATRSRLGARNGAAAASCDEAERHRFRETGARSGRAHADGRAAMRGSSGARRRRSAPGTSPGSDRSHSGAPTSSIRSTSRSDVDAPRRHRRRPSRRPRRAASKPEAVEDPADVASGTRRPSRPAILRAAQAQTAARSRRG